MRPSHWPFELEHVLAKSPEMGGETLAQHTWDVLCRLADLYRLRPAMHELVDAPRLWHCLFWACLLHDFGKAARGFQAMLRGAARWKQRHEVLSLVFFDWIADALSAEEQRWVLAAIVSHHRDAATLQQQYPDIDPDPVAVLVQELDAETVASLWRWIATCAEDWMHALGFSADTVQMLTLMPVDLAVNTVTAGGALRIRRWLSRYDAWVDSLNGPQAAAQVVLPVLLRGLTTTADHMASAHLVQLPRPICEPWEQLAERILAPLRSRDPAIAPYAHQCSSAACSSGSAILIAPTGSGKTEAALYWALGTGNKPVPRLFYALPYQASMNAMYDRLRSAQKGFGDEAVGLQHGRALQSLYARLINQEQSRIDAVARARWARNINTLNARPVKVFSPYQMLKAAFQIRGFEAMLTDYAQAAFIFDEIHAYDPGRLALIVALMRYLRLSYGARFFVMSATFPQLIRDKLADALGPHQVISADETVFRAFQRHRLHVLDGELLTEGVARIVEDLRAGKSVLACANTVRRAQALRAALVAADVSPEQIVLIHSRYVIKDRIQREHEIMQRCEIGVRGEPFVLVATQVVEVSLNIDLDTIYSDPAPLEALLQRFGRVNRACRKGICPVHVFRQPDDGQYVYGRSKNKDERGHIVRVTLRELECHQGEAIDEAAINHWLDRIYADPQLAEQWERDYQLMQQNAESVLGSLRPFNSNAQKEEQFEALFDNVEVLPACFESDYLECIQNGEFIESSAYFVGISRQKYGMLAAQGLVRPVADPEGLQRKWVVRLPYDQDTGLQFEQGTRDPDWD